MLSARENYCPDQVTFLGAEPSHPTTMHAHYLLLSSMTIEEESTLEETTLLDGCTI
jgi:hypothetical protein